jgi:hypothetical protein
LKELPTVSTTVQRLCLTYRQITAGVWTSIALIAGLHGVGWKGK